ncbi:ecdysone-inducible gene L2 isoform X2 [Arctopsyche grandis]|uniref:ecdysone-inducible gene L2 isoform X2 n=1 Tax=Arctopsyche grandis TaxID=121162 RepID=UPI00406D6CA7
MISFCATTFLAILSIHCATMAAKIPLLDTLNSDPTEEDNSLSPSAGLNYPEENREWVQLTNVPSTMVRRVPGVPLELECEASGSPAPTIRWLRNGLPITEIEDYENNALPQGSSKEMAKVRSRLIINNILPIEKNTYTCVAQVGSKTTYFTTTVFTSQGFPKAQNFTEYLMLNKEILTAPSKPRIVLYYSVIMENIGNTLIVPCKVVGNPRPDIYWIDNEESIIPLQHPRIKIMRTGELVIHGLRWSDMGGYTCVAKNPISKDTITTFVYPMLNEK